MIIIMIFLMILHMNDNKIMLIEMLSFLMMCSFISYVSEAFKVFVIPEFDVWDVMYSGMLYIWWYTVLINVLRSSCSALCDFIHLLHYPKLTQVRRTQLTRPSINGWSYPSITGAQWYTTVLHIEKDSKSTLRNLPLYIFIAITQAILPLNITSK